MRLASDETSIAIPIDPAGVFKRARFGGRLKDRTFRPYSEPM